MRLLRACLALIGLSFRRLWWSTNTLMLCFPLLGCGLFVLAATFRRQAYSGSQGFERFTEDVVLVLFSTFLLPIIALAYGTSSIGGDREDRTLLFLLMRPIPRSMILVSKYLATLPLVLGLTMGSFACYCGMAGSAGREAFFAFWQPILYLSLAYTSLFHLFSVFFRHATILALIYSLFMEWMLGAMPGVIKRLAVNFYGRSMMIELGNLDVPPNVLFAPVSAEIGAYSLWGITLGGLLLSIIAFGSREYHDLT